MRIRFITRWRWRMTRVDWAQFEAELSEAGDGCTDCGCPLDSHEPGGCEACGMCDGFV